MNLFVTPESFFAKMDFLVTRWFFKGVLSRTRFRSAIMQGMSSKDYDAIIRNLLAQIDFTIAAECKKYNRPYVPEQYDNLNVEQMAHILAAHHVDEYERRKPSAPNASIH